MSMWNWHQDGKIDLWFRNGPPRRHKANPFLKRGENLLTFQLMLEHVVSIHKNINLHTLGKN